MCIAGKRKKDTESCKILPDMSGITPKPPKVTVTDSAPLYICTEKQNIMKNINKPIHHTIGRCDIYICWLYYFYSVVLLLIYKHETDLAFVYEQENNSIRINPATTNLNYSMAQVLHRHQMNLYENHLHHLLQKTVLKAMIPLWCPV